MKGVFKMNTVESLFRYYKKIGPSAFENFIESHPEYSDMAQIIIDLETQKRVAA